MQRVLRGRQSAKILEIRGALFAAGFVDLRQQTAALGLCRSTTWAVLQAFHKGSGLSAHVIRKMLECPNLPGTVRAKLHEYIEDKVHGRYGHSPAQARRFLTRLTEQPLRSSFAIIDNMSDPIAITEDQLAPLHEWRTGEQMSGS